MCKITTILTTPQHFKQIKLLTIARPLINSMNRKENCFNYLEENAPAWSDPGARASIEQLQRENPDFDLTSYIQDEMASDVAGRMMEDPSMLREMFKDVSDLGVMDRIKNSVLDFFDKVLYSLEGRGDEYRALVEARDGYNKMFNELHSEREVSQEVTDGTRQRGEGGGSDRGKFSIGNDEKGKKTPNNFDNNGKAFNFANDNSGILKISKDEYTDDFRRVQAESQRLSDEDVRQYHRSDRTDEFKRRLGSVYAGLLSARGRSRTSFWINLSHKHEDGTNVDFHFALVNGQLFHDIFEVNRRYLKNGELVDLHDNYDDAKCFISDDGLCGFAIEPNGNLVSVFSLNPSDKKGFLYAIRDFVREQGATHLDAYASKNQPLQKIYEKTLGFKTASEMEYNMEYDHDQIAANHGNPDVVFMVANEGPVEKRRFTKDQYDDAEAYQLSQIPDKRFSLASGDREYAEAVARGDREKVDKMLRAEAERKGYKDDVSYQGSLAFNGAAPSRNAYYETKEERIKAFREGDFEGDYTLGDFIDNGLDNNDLGWQLENPIAASGRDKATLSSIRNLSTVVKNKRRTIKMYRAIDANIAEGSFRNGDWVTPSREYAERHIGLQDWENGRIIEKEVPIDDIWWNGDDINEWGYDDGKGYVYKNTENNRKLLEPTYDDQGNLIPLSQRFNDENPDKRFSLGDDRRRPTFYSNAERAVENVKQEKASAEQWKAMLTKAGGIKAGEDKWMGLSQWLDEHKGKSLTRGEVLEFVRDNGIEMEERTYQEGVVDPSVPEDVYNDFEDYYNSWTDDDFDTPLDHLEYAWDVYCNVSPSWIRESIEPHLYSDGTWDLRVSDRDILRKQVGINSDYSINRTRLGYTTEGLENKREVAFVVPGVEPYQEGDAIHFGPENEGRAVMWVRFGETTDTDGKRVLVIDEVQSNRHQDAREKGYREENKKAIRERYEQAEKAYKQALAEELSLNERAKSSHGGTLEGLTEEEWDVLRDANRRTLETREARAAAHEANVYAERESVSGVPAAPFEKNWHEVAMKRMLRLAADEGFDKVAWTTGEQQAERYGIGDRVDNITVEPYKAESANETDGFDVDINMGNDRVSMYVTHDGEITSSDGMTDFAGKKLSEVVGKEIADKILSAREHTQLSGDGLRIGGEGMKAFYDGILTKYMDKYCRKWGSRVGETMLSTPGGEVMHSVDVTGEMRKSVSQGQPLFSLSPVERSRVCEDNERFNAELEKQERGELPDGHIYQLGRPCSVLRSAGFPDDPIQLSATKLAQKAAQHGFDINDVRNLAAAIQDPVAVFAYGDKDKAQNVIVEIVKDGKSFVVGVHFNQNHDGITISSIRGIFNKDNAEWLNWISQGKLLYVNKEKIQTLIDQQRTNLADVGYLDLEDVAKVVQNFENPIIPDKKTAGNGGEILSGEDLVAEARRVLADPESSGFAKRAAQSVLRGGGVSIQGLDGYTEGEVLSAVREDIERKLEEAGMEDVAIKGMALHGSRLRGDARKDSDLDVVVEYAGDISEDGLFNVLNEEPLELEGIRVDINPITRGKSGMLEQYMERSRRYDAERLGGMAAAEPQRTRPGADGQGTRRYSLSGEPLPVGRGAFGDIYDQFKGKAKEAIAFLLKKKGGEATGALHHKEIGDIDLVWGEEGTGKSDGFGLAKLVKYHPEVLDNLQEILDDMHVAQRSENRVRLESDTHQAAVRLTWDNQKKNWLLTAFEKRNSALDNTTDTGKTSERGLRNGTATPQNTVSDGKVSGKVSDVQEDGEKSDGVRYSLGKDDESRRIFEQSKKKFGVTGDIREAGYVLPDGEMLDFRPP